MDNKKSTILNTYRIVHLTIVAVAMLLIVTRYSNWIVAIYFPIFMATDYFAEKYEEDRTVTKYRYAYVYLSASLYMWMLFIMYIPEMYSGTWTTGASLDMLYTLIVCSAVVTLIIYKWIAKIKRA